MTTVESCRCDECLWYKDGNCDLDSIVIDDTGYCSSVRKKGEKNK